MPIFPKKIGAGSHVRVIAPSRTFKIISDETRDIANKRFVGMGIKVSYSKNADTMNEFLSSSIESRVEDIHEAFRDKTVDVILTAIGGFNSNEILPYLDYNLIKENPKIFCGFSDITALTNAIYAKTGLVTYSGPHFSSFGMEKGFDYTSEYFRKCFMIDQPYSIKASKDWSDDAWFIKQDDRTFIPNDGYWLINKGIKDKVNGVIIGGNLCTLQLLQGTEYMPNIEKSILFVEDNFMTKFDDFEFSRNLTSLFQQTNIENIKAVIIGRFQKESNITKERISAIISSKKELENIPVIANVDFGHTTPIITFPLGGEISLEWDKQNNNFDINIIKH